LPYNRKAEPRIVQGLLRHSGIQTTLTPKRKAMWMKHGVRKGILSGDGPGIGDGPHEIVDWPVFPDSS
jgi:hypothetical protein